MFVVVECELWFINMTSTMSPLIKVARHPPTRKPPSPAPEAPLELSSVAVLLADM